MCGASDHECYVVRGQRVGAFVEISLSRDRRQKHRSGADTYTTLELLAVRRFRHLDTAAFMPYANNLEDAARYAARSELGYTVHTVAEGGAVRVSLVGRIIDAHGRIETALSHEHRFENPDSHIELVEANEKATELRALAQELNDEWASRRNSQLLELRTAYERDDAQAEAAEELHRIVDAEGD